MSKCGVFPGPYFPVFIPNTENTDHKKLRIWTLFTQCKLHWNSNEISVPLQYWNYALQFMLNHPFKKLQGFFTRHCWFMFCFSLNGSIFNRKKLENARICLLVDDLNWKDIWQSGHHVTAIGLVSTAHTILIGISFTDVIIHLQIFYLYRCFTKICLSDDLCWWKVETFWL